ncbi:phospholipid carrier-dependent glycosyltransferase [Leifsonia sp. NPDC080035]|uniref:Phospholipid carrier-dependent glycosyltransferase n=1 Tax=Leifsonia sp. NPDC080035 TaxID=3143936 RepID=A0AAU7G829_9MICO
MTATTPGIAPPLHRGRRFRAWTLLNWVPIVLVLASLLVTGVVTVRHTQALSPLDEWVYYDYTLKIPSQGIVHRGETLGKGALEQMSCFGDAYGRRGDPCGSDYSDLSRYPQGAKTSADIYPPTYFAVTWAIGEAIHAVTGIDFLTAARLSGLFWLSGGVLVLYLLLRRFGVPKLVTLGVGLIVIASPSTYWSSTYISTDAPVLLAGAAALLIAFRAIDGKGGGWWLVPIAVVCALTKVTTLLGVGLAVLILLMYALWRRGTEPLGRDHRRRLILIAVVSAVAAVAAQVLWIGVRALIAVGPAIGQGVESAGPIGVRWLLTMATVFVDPGPLLFAGWNPGWRLPAIVQLPMQWLPIAGVVGALFMATRSIATKAFGIATAVSLVVFAPLLALAMSVALGGVYPVPPRYGIALIPAFMTALALIVRNRLATWLLIGYGAFCCVVIVVYAILHR